MPVETTPRQQNVLVFNARDDSPPPELRQIFSQVNLMVVDSAKAASLLSADGDAPVDWQKAIGWLRQGEFDAAVILTSAGQSPYTLGYLCYLAGIPIRIGQSHEFGGQVLSHCAPPDTEDDTALLALLRVSGRAIA